MSYHHGSLRAALIEAAAEAVASHGVAALSLRALARELGVSHTAPRHHFTDKRGLLTALATDGYARLADKLFAAGDDFLEAGVAYVRFAIENPGHFAVMYQPELVDEDDAELQEARGRTGEALLAGANGRFGTAPSAGAHPSETAGASDSLGPVAGPGSFPPYALLAWSAAHGIANLALAGTLTRMGYGDDKEALADSARRALTLLGPA
ncbi:MAG: TetR/AcrR family transcriptional regulator [Trueperaceae bacterium]